MTGATAGTSAAAVATAAVVVTGDIFFVAAFEVGFIPAATFEAKASSGNFLFQFGLIAGRAYDQWLGT